MSASATQAVFLSYASQDADAARHLCETLRGAGMEVWFDADGGLEHGDEWDAKIRRQIKECVLFIPLISAHTQARQEGYFRIEWELAAERAMGFASGVAFILPIVIDATREPDALVPDRFRKVQWTRLPGGNVSPEVLARFVKLWSHRTGVLAHEAKPKAIASTASPAPVEFPAAKTPFPKWLVAGFGVAVLALVAFVALRPTAKVTPTPVEPPTRTVSDKSISVLPFENRSKEPDSAYFANGIQDEIIAGLSLLSDLRVIGSSNSVEVFRA